MYEVSVGFHDCYDAYFIEYGTTAFDCGSAVGYTESRIASPKKLCDIDPWLAFRPFSYEAS